MNCREFLKRMPELLDRDPDPAATDDLMEHAGVCPKCAAELDAALSALSAVSPSLPLKASPGLKERTMKQILALDSQPNPIAQAPSARWGLMAHPWRYAVAAAAVLAIIALSTIKGGGSIAFAKVMEQIRKASACTYTMTIMTEGQPTMRMKTSYKDPGRMRMESSTPGAPGNATSIADINKKKLILLQPLSKQCFTFDLTGNTTPSPQSAQINLFEDLRRIPDSGAKPIGTKEIGGIKAVGFHASQAGMSYTIWADPGQPKILLIEYESENIKGMKGEISDFNFDAQLDDSIFSVDPPEGYAVTNGKSLKMESPSEETFIKFLRKWAEDTEGDLFLPSLDQAGMMKSGMARKKTAPKPPTAMGQEFMKQVHESTIGLMFVMQMTKANDFHYAGEGITLGEAQKPICWYKPTGSQNYRVIYGDLSIRETAPGNLPSSGAK